MKLNKEYSFVCDLSRQDGSLLINLEQLIDDLQPAGVSTTDPEAFLGVIDTKSSNAPNDDIENSLIRPKTSEVDELADIGDRFAHTFEAEVEAQMEKNFAREGEDDGVLLLRGQEKIPLKFVRQLAYIISWSLWGRAISSLDFVELSVRKPSLKRLLTSWSKMVTIMTIEGSKVMDRLPTGDLVSDEMKKRFKRHFLLALPRFFFTVKFFPHRSGLD